MHKAAFAKSLRASVRLDRQAAGTQHLAVPFRRKEGKTEHVQKRRAVGHARAA